MVDEAEMRPVRHADIELPTVGMLPKQAAVNCRKMRIDPLLVVAGIQQHERAMQSFECHGQQMIRQKPKRSIHIDAGGKSSVLEHRLCGSCSPCGMPEDAYLRQIQRIYQPFRKTE